MSNTDQHFGLTKETNKCYILCNYIKLLTQAILNVHWPRMVAFGEVGIQNCKVSSKLKANTQKTP